MKTRLISLLLCLVMVLSVALTGCAQKTDEEAKEDITEDASQSAITLTMWVVAEQKPNQDVQNRVSRLINSITKSKFKIQLLINYFTEDEYRSKLDATIAAFEANKQNLEVSESDDAEKDGPVEDETETNAQGLSVIKYPEAMQNQVDIIYIAGEDMYFDYIAQGRLASLNDELASTAKKIKEYVSPALLSAAQVNGVTYAIPNNHPIGEYTYMLLNKQLMEDWGQDAYATEGMIDGLFSENLYPFLNLAATQENVVPINYSYEECLKLLAHYWNVSSDDYSMVQDFSVFGHYYESIDDISRGEILLKYESLFSNEAFVKDFLQLNKFRFDGYLKSDAEAEGKQIAVKFMTGDASVMGADVYEDADGTEYYPVVVGYPTVTSEDTYGNMFGVYTYSRSVSRSMSVVTYLNTNADFRNLLQYGEEGIDYKVDEKGNLSRLGTGYMMDIWATGNAFIAHPDTERQLTQAIWENGKQQNRDALVSPLLGFNFESNAYPQFYDSNPLSDAGYDMSLQTNLDKTLVQQNAKLASWLQSLEGAKAGVYVLKSVKVGDSYNTIQYYIYDNSVSGNVSASSKIETVTEKRNNRDVLTGLNFVVDYAPASGASATPGYTLTGVTVRAMSSYADMSSLKVTKSGAAVDTTVKSVAEFVYFDTYHTGSYDVEVYNDLKWVEVRKNIALDDWLRAMSKGKPDNIKGAADARSSKLEYYDADTNTYTFVLFRDALYYQNEVSVDVNAVAGKLMLNFNVAESNLELEVEDDAHRYVLCYVTVTADPGFELVANYTLNGTAIDFGSRVTTDVNPEFEKLGEMDTELVKFIERVNGVVLAELNRCESFEEVSALVADISKLLDSSMTKKADFVYTAANFPTLIKIYKSSSELFSALGVRDAEMLIENIQSASSYTVVTKPDVPDGNGVPKPATYEGASYEEYIYFNSPYVVYYNWLADYKYLPKTK